MSVFSAQNRTVICNEALYYYRRNRPGNSLSIMLRMDNTKYTKSAISAYLFAYEIIKQEDKKASLNALQRVLIHRCNGMRSAIKTKESHVFKYCSKGYLANWISFLPWVRTADDVLWVAATGLTYMKLCLQFLPLEK